MKKLKSIFRKRGVCTKPPAGIGNQFKLFRSLFVVFYDACGQIKVYCVFMRKPLHYQASER